MNLENNPVADLRRAVLSLEQVPAGTPVEASITYGAPSVITYDDRAGIVRVSVGWGSTVGRPSMGQLRAWLGLPAEGAPAPAPPAPPPLTGAWSIARGLEKPSWMTWFRVASAGVSGYHGVRRNGGSIFWGVVWFAFGAWLPGIVPLIAVGQGYGTCDDRGCPR